MNPAILALLQSPTLKALLISLGPALFSKFFSNPAGDLQKQVLATLSPEHIQNLSNVINKNLLQSEGFSNAQSDIARGVSTLNANLNRSLAARGLETSGVGAVSSSLAKSAGGFALGNLRSSVAEAALRSATELAKGQATALTQGGPVPSIGNELLGGGLRALIPYLLSQGKQTGQPGGISSANTSFDLYKYLYPTG